MGENFNLADYDLQGMPVQLQFLFSYKIFNIAMPDINPVIYTPGLNVILCKICHFFLEFKTNSHGLDRRNMDLSVEPCDDFSQFANGRWFERNPIPEEESIWSTFSEMRQRNYKLLREILEEAAASGPRRLTRFRWATSP